MTTRPTPRPWAAPELAPIEEHPHQFLDTAIEALRTDILARLELLRPQFGAIDEKHTQLSVKNADLCSYVFQPARVLGRLQIILGRRVVIDPEEWRVVLVLRVKVADMLAELEAEKERLRAEIDHLLSSLPRKADVDGPGYLKPLSVAVVSLGVGSGVSVLTLDPLASTGGGWI